ncbi:hypothetical protein RRF57_005633 [Xylaria bambusicola]|uniref:Uncharacterized protein n=1 Tax=Xylaria bambusicola TaxID=326684 RepID=A0AAN7Z868_9PEZI
MRYLQQEYKQIEREVFDALFLPTYPEHSRWQTRHIESMVKQERKQFSEGFRLRQADKLERAIELRNEAMLLWRPDTQAAYQHQFWIDRVISMVDLLRSASNVPAVEERQSSTSSSSAGSVASSPSLTLDSLAITPAAVVPTPATPATPITPPQRVPVPTPVTPPQRVPVPMPVTPPQRRPVPGPGSPPISAPGSPPSVADNGGSSWSTVDLDICIEEISYWRETMAKIWQKAIDDPTEMSMADLSLQSAIRFFKRELERMQRFNKEWYERDSDSWNRATLDHMAESQPDGTGGALSRIATMFRVKGFAPIVKAAVHQSPLLDWLEEKSYNHPGTHVAWLLWEDSIELTKQHADNLKRVTIARINDALSEIRPLRDERKAERIFEGVGERTSAMIKYTVKQNCVPCFAVVYTWADYLRIMFNILVFEMSGRLIRAVTYSYELNALLKTWPPVEGASEAEQFINKFHDYIYAGFPRPTNLRAARRVLTQWLREANRPGKISTTQTPEENLSRLMDTSVVDYYGQSWTRIAVTEDKFAVRRNEFLRSGSDEWWQAIADRAKQKLQHPSLIRMTLRIEDHPESRNRIDLLGEIDGFFKKRDMEAAKRTLASMPYLREWFDGVVTP